MNTEITNSKELSKYFGHTEDLEELIYDEIKLKVDILTNDIIKSGLTFDDFIDEITERNLSGRKEIAAIYSNLSKNKYISVNSNEIHKDWNDVSKSVNNKLIVKESEIIKNEYQLHG